MTTIRIPGVKGYVSNGTPYFYLRKNGARIVEPGTKRPIDPTKEPEAFAAAVDALKRKLAALPPAPRAKAGTLQALIEEWRGIPGTDGRPKKAPSLEWQALRPATRRSYELVINPDGGYLQRAIKMALDEIQLQAIDQPNIVRFRNKVAKKFGFWTGNYTVKVLRTMFRFGNLYGHLKGNPAIGVPALARPEGLAQQHRPWADTEFNAMLEGARERGWEGVMLTLALGRFAGWPIGDSIAQPPSVWQKPRLVYIRRKTSKRGRVNSVRAPDPLVAVLEEVTLDPKAKTLVVNASGQPYTVDGMRTMIHRLCTDLVEDGKVKPGLNIHGLRHSLGKELYDLGLERETRKRMMAHESDAASRVYERDGDGGKMADKAVRALNRKHRKEI